VSNYSKEGKHLSGVFQSETQAEAGLEELGWRESPE
jgi:hypothetical protein